MNLCMIGTGYVGLVTGACFSDLGNKVICVDINQNKINNLNSGKIPIYEPGLEELVKKNFNQNKLSFSTDISSAIKKSDIVFICVGTPTKKKTNTADLKYIYRAANIIAKNINKYKREKKEKRPAARAGRRRPPSPRVSPRLPAARSASRRARRPPRP